MWKWKSKCSFLETYRIKYLNSPYGLLAVWGFFVSFIRVAASVPGCAPYSLLKDNRMGEALILIL